MKEKIMKYKLQKKKKAWDLFRNEIKILIGICISFTLGITVWLNWEKIIKLLDWLNLKPMEFVAYFIALPFIILFMISYLTTVIKYLYRHLYIPLTHEELEANNIYTLEEYKKFIYHLFMGSCPLKRVHNEIKKTAKELNAKSNETLNHFYFFDYDNQVVLYGVFIFIVTVVSIVCKLSGEPQYQSIYSFLCMFASLLLISHFGIIVWEFSDYYSCSVFKIARMKVRHLKEEKK